MDEHSSRSSMPGSHVGVSIAVVRLATAGVPGGVPPQESKAALALHLISCHLLCLTCRSGLVLIIARWQVPWPTHMHHPVSWWLACQGRWGVKALLSPERLAPFVARHTCSYARFMPAMLPVLQSRTHIALVTAALSAWPQARHKLVWAVEKCATKANITCMQGGTLRPYYELHGCSLMQTH